MYGQYQQPSPAAAAKKVHGYMKVNYAHVISNKGTFRFGFLPGVALIDLKTMKVILKDSWQKQYSASEVIQACKKISP